jgi:hypothetical protein
MAMNLATILSSRSQRRAFMLATVLVLATGVALTLLLAAFAPSTPVWNALVGISGSVAAGGVFALLSGFYLWYFFADPNELTAQSYIFPKDIAETLEGIAKTATEYKIFVRTGRHFRAKILPLLVQQARASRSPVRLEVVLLDFRELSLCERYARYRQASSFDGASWNANYVRIEVLATILALMRSVNENCGLIRANLSLSARLSTFRIEGSADALMVTREDPKDAAFKYRRGQAEFAAYSAEFSWVLDEAKHIAGPADGDLWASLRTLFGEGAVTDADELEARKVTGAPSPYVR